MTQKSPSGHHRATLWDWIFATEACIDNRKKLVRQQYPLHICPHNMANLGLGWDRFGSLGHPCKLQRLSRLGSVLLHATLVVGVSQTLRRWTEGATYLRQAAITLFIGRHSSWFIFLQLQYFSGQIFTFTQQHILPWLKWFIDLLRTFLNDGVSYCWVIEFWHTLWYINVVGLHWAWT